MLNKNLISCFALFACLAPQVAMVNAQTIQELTDAARARKLNELKKDSGAPAPVPTAGTTPLPQSKKSNMATGVELLSIYGIGSNLVAEIADEDTSAKYQVGGVTPSGWTVVNINKQSVDLIKTGKNKKTGAKKTLRFWKLVEDGSQTASNSNSYSAFPAPAGMGQPQQATQQPSQPLNMAMNPPMPSIPGK